MKSMKIETMAAVIATIAAHETMVNCVGIVIKLATMNPIMIPIPTKNVVLIELTILLLFIFIWVLKINNVGSFPKPTMNTPRRWW